MGPSALTLQAIGFRTLALLIIVGVQGGVVAAAAALLGDKGPGYDGRLSVAPSRHLDLAGAVSTILFGLGWGKPVAVDARQFRIGRAGIVLVVLAGFVGLLALAFVFNALARPALTALPLTAGLATAAFLRAASGMAIWFALLGLVPVPPLTGGLILDALGVRISRQMRWILVAALFLAVATGWARRLLGPAHAVLAFVFGA